MIIVSKKFEFDAAHKIGDHDGKCENLHGHTWKVRVSYIGRELNNKNMLVDFGKLKEDIGNVIDELDHSYLNEVLDLKNVTSEVLGKYIKDEIPTTYRDGDVCLHSVEVWESERSKVML